MSKILVFMSLYAIIFFTSCGSEKEEKEEETKFLVTSPLKTDTVINKDYVCQIRAIQHIEVRALERGYLQKIYVRYLLYRAYNT